MLGSTLSYVGKNKWQFCRFGIVGVATFALNFSLVWLFYGVWRVDYRVAVTCAYVLTVVAHFLLNRSFTYRLEGFPEAPSAVKYGVLLLVNYLITLTITTATVELLGLTPYYGVVFSVFVTAFSSFLLMKHFVFAQREQPK